MGKGPGRAGAHKRTVKARRKHRDPGSGSKCSDVVITRADGSVEVQPPYEGRQLRLIVKERNVSPAMRARVMRRDEHLCRYCRGAADAVDHVIPIAKGGSNRLHNLVAACIDCNTRKGTNTWKPQPRRAVKTG